MSETAQPAAPVEPIVRGLRSSAAGTALDDRRPVVRRSSYRAAAAVASIFSRPASWSPIRASHRRDDLVSREEPHVFFDSWVPIPEDPNEAERRPGRVDLPTEVFHRKREVSVQPRAAGTPNEPSDGDAVADRSDRSQRRRGGRDRPTEFSAVAGFCPRTIRITRAARVTLISSQALPPPRVHCLVQVSRWRGGCAWRDPIRCQRPSIDCMFASYRAQCS